MLISKVVLNSSLSAPCSSARGKFHVLSRTCIFFHSTVSLPQSVSLPGILPAACDTDVITGMKIPAALDVVPDTAGVSTASAVARPTARPSVLLPHMVSSWFAVRSPRPVFSNPYSHPQHQGQILLSDAVVGSPHIADTQCCSILRLTLVQSYSILELTLVHWPYLHAVHRMSLRWQQ